MTHKPLQTMRGKPLNMTFIPGSTPTTFHTPIPVPHHWKKKVKQDLNQDVSLGIIKPVPVGTPTTWCSRMVVAHKKDSTSWRSVDLFNVATIREMHHKPSPFNQALVVPAHMKKKMF